MKIRLDGPMQIVRRDGLIALKCFREWVGIVICRR
jgi:hypothetical protein